MNTNKKLLLFTNALPKHNSPNLMKETNGKRFKRLYLTVWNSSLMQEFNFALRARKALNLYQHRDV